MPAPVAKPFLAVAALLLAASATAGAREATTLRVREGAPIDPVAILRALHDDVDLYVRAVRLVPEARAGGSRLSIYSGLVRPGGSDPRVAGDAPLAGRGRRNDIVLYEGSFDPHRSPGWPALILDHEYFHARHLARGTRTPLVDFGDEEANHAYYEAAAWWHVLSRGMQGAYGELSEPDRREVAAAYRRHRESFRAFLEERQPSAWAHYGRFLPEAEAASGSR